MSKEVNYEELLKEAMAKGGGGGDIEELLKQAMKGNNLEGLLQQQQQQPMQKTNSQEDVFKQSNLKASDYEDALKLKEQGNEAFKKGNNQEALKCYSRIFMYLGMNPRSNISNFTGQANPSAPRPKDPLEAKCDELRLNGFNNMAAVYAKMNNWQDCKEKCNKVLDLEANNAKALFRRGQAQRQLGSYELARSDLLKAQELMGAKDKAIEKEMKLLEKDEKKADKVFYQKMQQAMQKNARRKKNKEEKPVNPPQSDPTKSSPPNTDKDKD